jgi:hypothetical protein
LRNQQVAGWLSPAWRAGDHCFGELCIPWISKSDGLFCVFPFAS